MFNFLEARTVFQKGNHVQLFLYGVLFVILAWNLVSLMASMFNRAIHPDEFQHVHIAWNMFYNHLLIYRDFWDHHGFIYPLVNTFWLSLFQVQADFSVYYFLRLTSFLYAIVYLFFTYKIAVWLFKDQLFGLASVTLLSSLYYFQERMMEIRPDTIQNVFWLAGLYLLICNLRSLNIWALSVSGFLFGLTVATNTKAIAAIGFVFLFLCIDVLFVRKHVQNKYSKILILGSSFLAVPVCITVYFTLIGEVHSYFVNAFYANFVILDNLNVDHIFLETLENSIIPTSGIFLCIAIAGIVFLVRENRKDPKREELLIALLAVFCMLTAPWGPWDQYYLVFLPFLSITGIYFLKVAASRVKGGTWVRIGLSAAVCTVLLMALHQDVRYNLDLELTPELLKQQKEETNTILTTITREEKVGYFFNEFCGAFVFNRDVQYYWLVHPWFREVYKTLSGEDAMGAGYVENLQTEHVPYIVTNVYTMDRIDSKEVLKYVEEKYTPVSNCIMKRSSSSKI